MDNKSKVKNAQTLVHNQVGKGQYTSSGLVPTFTEVLIRGGENVRAPIYRRSALKHKGKEVHINDQSIN